MLGSDNMTMEERLEVVLCFETARAHIGQSNSNGGARRLEAERQRGEMGGCNQLEESGGGVRPAELYGCGAR
jgi:hypothetical protein